MGKTVDLAMKLALRWWEATSTTNSAIEDTTQKQTSVRWNLIPNAQNCLPVFKHMLYDCQIMKLIFMRESWNPYFRAILTILMILKNTLRMLNEQAPCV